MPIVRDEKQSQGISKLCEVGGDIISRSRSVGVAAAVGPTISTNLQ